MCRVPNEQRIVPSSRTAADKLQPASAAAFVEQQLQQADSAKKSNFFDDEALLLLGVTTDDQPQQQQQPQQQTQHSADVNTLAPLPWMEQMLLARPMLPTPPVVSFTPPVGALLGRFDWPMASPALSLFAMSTPTAQSSLKRTLSSAWSFADDAAAVEAVQPAAEPLPPFQLQQQQLQQQQQQQMLEQPSFMPASSPEEDDMVMRTDDSDQNDITPSASSAAWSDGDYSPHNQAASATSINSNRPSFQLKSVPKRTKKEAKRAKLEVDDCLDQDSGDSNDDDYRQRRAALVITPGMSRHQIEAIKRERNRLAAERYRQKGRDTITMLQGRVDELEAENAKLRATIKQLRHK